MDMEIKNRIEAFLSWKTSGVKPIGWDLEPQNKQEMWIAEEAKRLDSIEYGENSGEITRKAPVKATEGTNDYNELENIPILPIDEELVEGKYYYDEGGRPILTAIPEHDQIFYENDILQFNKAGNWDSFLEYLFTQEHGQECTLIYMADGGPMDFVVCIKDSLDDDFFGVCIRTKEDIYIPIYATKNHTVTFKEEVTFIQGWQNVDDNGNYIITDEEIHLDGINQNYEGWNGILLGIPDITKASIGKVRKGELKPLLTKTPIYRHVEEAKGSMGQLNFVIYSDSWETLDWSAIKSILAEENYIHSATGIYNGLTVAGIANDPWRSGCINIYQLYQGQFHEVSVETASLSLSEDIKTLF